LGAVVRFRLEEEALPRLIPLVLTPGFFTDILGFACLIPSLRRKIAQYVIEHHLLVAQSGEIFKQRSSFSNGAIEGEFKKED
jgi:UPF0716 protein FxsA